MTLRHDLVKAYHRKEKLTICGICYGDALTNPTKEVQHYYEGQWVSMHLPYPASYFSQLNSEAEGKRYDFRYCMPHKIGILEKQVLVLAVQMRKLQNHSHKQVTAPYDNKA